MIAALLFLTCFSAFAADDDFSRHVHDEIAKISNRLAEKRGPFDRAREEEYARAEAAEREAYLRQRGKRAEVTRTGALFQYIAPTSPEHGFNPEVGFDPSPSSEGNEIGDAFFEFYNPREAMRQFERIKRDAGFQGGRVFAAFRYENEAWGHAPLLAECGISKAESKNWKVVRKASPYHIVAGNTGHTLKGDREAEGTFSNFKLASRAERVRSIARCLSSFADMPHLKPRYPDLEHTYLDEASYLDLETWLGKQDTAKMARTQPQRRAVARCLMGKVASSYSEGVGNTVVVRTFQSDTSGHRTVIAVVNHKAAQNLLSATDNKDMKGIWPSSEHYWYSKADPYQHLKLGVYLPECLTLTALADASPLESQLTPAKRDCATAGSDKTK